LRKGLEGDPAAAGPSPREAAQADPQRPIASVNAFTAARMGQVDVFEDTGVARVVKKLCR